MTKFKTTLLAMAVSAAAFSVQAAQVSLYGSVSTGVLYQNQASLSGGTGNQESKDSFTMESGFWGDSIWGITGEEDLGNGWTVGFTLENEFGSDTGEMAGADPEGSSVLFDSQAYLRIGNDKVNFAFGNIGGLASAGGDFDLLCAFDPMEAYVGVAGLGAFASKDFASGNMAVVEVTPMEGFKVSLMGNTGDDDSEAKWSDRHHYYGLGVSYENGPLALAAIAEMRKYNRIADWDANADNDASWTFTVAAAYDFEVVRPSFVYQHASKTHEFAAGDISEDAYNFDSFMLGATAPLGQGTLRASVQYVKGENDAVSDEEGSATILGLAYTYDMSKRTTLYGAAFYSVGGDGLDKDLGANDTEFGLMGRADYNSVGFGVGLVHTF